MLRHSMKWYHFSLIKQTVSTVFGQSQILQASWKSAWEAAWPISIWQLASPAQKLKLYQPKLLFFAANWTWATVPTPFSPPPNLFIWGCLDTRDTLTRHDSCEETSLSKLWQTRSSWSWRTLPPQTYSIIIWNLPLLFSALHKTNFYSCSIPDWGQEAFL